LANVALLLPEKKKLVQVQGGYSIESLNPVIEFPGAVSVPETATYSFSQPIWRVETAERL